MSCCAQCVGVERLFNEKTARRELRTYKRKGADKATRVLISGVRARMNGATRLLDIGGGIGAVQFELIESGVLHVTSVDASTGYLKVAEEEATQRGIHNQIQYVFGDFTYVAEGVEQHDLVTLDKVICCYPDMHELVRSSARKCNHLYALVYPKNGFAAKLFQTIIRVGMSLIRSPFRMYLHANSEVDAILEAEGFREVETQSALWWQIRLFERVKDL